jgi:hypothetical protein
MLKHAQVLWIFQQEQVMNHITGPIARIALRYLSGGLVSIGFLLPADAAAIIGDPEIVNAFAILLGLAASAAAEAAYAFAKRWGWRT